MQYRRYASLSGAAPLVLLCLGRRSRRVPARRIPHRPCPSSVSPARHNRLCTQRRRKRATTETILVNAKGLPSHYYKADTARKSQVSGRAGSTWPAGPSQAHRIRSQRQGRVLKEPGARQVAYNGHFLYTFVNDSPGHVT